jgi:hypothetical protein
MWVLAKESKDYVVFLWGWGSSCDKNHNPVLFQVGALIGLISARSDSDNVDGMLPCIEAKDDAVAADTLAVESCPFPSKWADISLEGILFHLIN